MSLINCPECGHEVSTTATACTNCGHPFARPVIERKVIVADLPEEEGFPKWAFIPLGILGLLLIGIMLLIFNRNSDDTANRAINVTVPGRTETVTTNTRDLEPTRQVTVPPSTTSQTVTVPPSSSTTSSVPAAIPQTAAPVPPTTITNVPADKGTVKIEAKIASKSGAVQNVKNEKFYLLDKDLETILSNAKVDPIEGQTLTNSFGLAVLFPDRYKDFKNDAFNAIKTHIKYSGLTDGSGVAQMKSIEPNSYYLFGVTKSGNGFAVWNSPVSVANGQNVLNLSPQSLTEVDQPN